MWTLAPLQWLSQSGFAFLPIRKPPLHTSTPAGIFQGRGGMSGTTALPAQSEAYRLLTTATEREGLDRRTGPRRDATRAPNQARSGCGLRAASWISPPHHLRTAEILSKRWVHLTKHY